MRENGYEERVACYAACIRLTGEAHRGPHVLTSKVVELMGKLYLAAGGRFTPEGWRGETWAIDAKATEFGDGGASRSEALRPTDAYMDCSSATLGPDRDCRRVRCDGISARIAS